MAPDLLPHCNTAEAGTYINNTRGRMKRQKGFSLIELLIVVAIILIIAAIAIPNLLRARIAANESSAVSSIRTINTAEVSYTTSFPNIGYSAVLSNLGTGSATQTSCSGVPTSTAACLLDSVLASGTKSGYKFAETGAASGSTNATYEAEGIPQVVNQTGVRGFCSVEDAVIRWEAQGTAAIGTNCNTLSALQ